MESARTEITNILVEIRNGRPNAAERLFQHVYKDLKKVAANQIRKERPNHTLQPTALVHEVYVRLLGERSPDWENRGHFFSAAAHAMRHVLVDYARKSRAQKRDGIKSNLELGKIAVAAAARADEILDVHVALDRLSAKSQRLKTIVEMRFFAGFTEEEIADILGISLRTVKRDWKAAQTWLYAEIRGAARSS
jgi:RNA polymerase sigma factor (TIGR02999 family)